MDMFDLDEDLIEALFEETKLVNWGTFEDILKIVLVKTSQKVRSNIISEIGQMRRIWRYFD